MLISCLVGWTQENEESWVDKTYLLEKVIDHPAAAVAELLVLLKGWPEQDTTNRERKYTKPCKTCPLWIYSICPDILSCQCCFDDLGNKLLFFVLSLVFVFVFSFLYFVWGLLKWMPLGRKENSRRLDPENENKCLIPDKNNRDTAHPHSSLFAHNKNRGSGGE